MTKGDIQLLYEYDRWANARVFDAAATLSNEQFTRDLGGAFRSVRDTLVHIVASEWGWLTYWQESAPTSAGFVELWNRCEALFHDEQFPNCATLRAKWSEVERAQGDFVERLTDDDLKRRLPLPRGRASLAHLMQHMANHATYHRGQISLMMRQLGAKPSGTDFDDFAVERPR